MSLTAIEKNPISTASQWARGLWAYYREYTHTAIHTASAAALTAFGLLVFVDPLFVMLAIASYVVPPIVLFTIGADLGNVSDEADNPTTQAAAGGGSNRTTNGDSDSDGRDSDSDSDSDGRDSDSDSDSDNGGNDDGN